MHGITPSRYFGDLNRASIASNGVVRRVQDDYNGAHLWMNIAKYIADARSVKANVTGRASFIETQIETFSFKKREDIMKERVVIRKVDDRAHLYDQKMRHE